MVKNDIIITYETLKKLNACEEALVKFKETFPNGAEYKQVLDACCARGYISWAEWLLERIGITGDVLVFEEDVSDNTLDIIYPGSIVFKRGAILNYLRAGGHIEATFDIYAKLNIIAGENISAGTYIEAGREIVSGKRIFANGRIVSGSYIDSMTDIISGKEIEAGKCIIAGGEIVAGLDYGIFAGTRVPISLWKEFAKIVAKKKPDNILSGYWEDKNV